MKVTVLGAGKVGRALARGLSRSGHRVRVAPARRGLPPARDDDTLIVLAVRDAALPGLAQRLARSGWVPRRAAIVHVAGALGPEVLAPLQPHCAGVGQAHPLLSFASGRVAPRFAGAHLLVAGDRVAVARARALGRALGMSPRSWRVDPVLYHAAAALAANGAVALVAAATQLLVLAGAPRAAASRALAPLLASVADNLARVGLPDALTGPIRRGDALTVQRHAAALGAVAPQLVGLWAASSDVQLELAHALAEARPADLARVRRVVRSAVRSQRNSVRR